MLKEAIDERTFSGYFITHAIRDALEHSPDIRIWDRKGREIAIIFGRKQNPGDPQHSVFCRISEFGRYSEKAAGGITLFDALKGVGSEVHDVVVRILRKTTRNGDENHE